MKTQFRDKPSTSRNEGSNGYLIILKDNQVHVGEETSFSHYTRKITTKAGVQYASEIAVSYDPDYQKLVFHRVMIYRNGKPLNKLNPSEFKVVQEESERERFIYNNNRTATLTLADVRVGDVIDYSFSVTGFNPIQPKYAEFFRFSTPEALDQLLVRVLAPANRPLQHKVYNTKQQMQVKPLGNVLEYTWKADQVPAHASEDNTPSWYVPYSYVWLSEFTSWAQVNDWALTLYTKPVGKSKELEKTIAAIKQADGSDEARLAAALKFVQNEVRYLGNEGGIYGYQPNDPAKVFEQRYGDCKDKAWLLCYMLGQMNIKAYPVLVNTGMRQFVKQELPSPYSFDHCVVKVELLTKSLWYDATISHQEGAYDEIYFPRYETGLVIKPGTKGFTDIPVSTNATIKSVEEYTLGAVKDEVFFNVQTDYTGYEADYIRSHYAANSHQEIEKGYLNFYASSFPGITTEQELLVNDQATANRFTTYENYKIADFWQEGTSDNGNLWTASILPLTLYSKLELPSTRIRNSPLALEYPYDYDHTIKIHVPSNWNVKDDEVEVENKAFSYKQTTTYDAQNRVVVLHFTFKTLKDHVSVEEMKAYFTAIKKIKDGMGFELTHSGPGTGSAIKMDGDWMSFVLVMLCLGVAGYGGYRLYQYDPAPADVTQTHARQIGGWLGLVGFGLVLTPFRLMYEIATGEWISLDIWNKLGDADSSLYNPVALWVLVLTIVYNVFFFCYSVLIVTLFFKKRSSLPRLVTIFYAVSLAGMIADACAVSALGGDVTTAYSSITRSLFAAAIWIPYFNLSRRVRETFINRLFPKQEDREEEAYSSFWDEPELQEEKQKEPVA
ncbi:DUF3857 domain-containing protein [Rufibacter sediminis]|uniref:DUF3857 domain-containing protein n=1 Tax=Rufibacter sediminis TaxID=2762756 RepID=A0ABR6VVT8_9BACT|nr:DUF3857 domain-containing protein [Rufibacter sediminis]MBC3541295.1 DUF3857 domain-containing protein [Rufibacter sediminis]